MTDDELLEIRQAFAIEGSELLSEMESALLALESCIDNSDEFNRLFRSTHTIKGSASIVGHEPLEQFCHCIEHILVRIREHECPLDNQLITLLLACHDHIRNLVDQFCPECAVEVPPIHSTLLERLATWKETPATGTISPTSSRMIHLNFPESSPDTTSAPFGFFEDAVDEHPPDMEALSALMPAQPDQPAPRSSPDQNQRAVRVDAAKLDQLSNLIIELVTASSTLESQVRQLSDMATMESTAHVVNLVKQIQEKSMVFRMVPVQTLFRRFQRIVHDGGKTNGKDIRLLISGGETELDKAVAEKLYDPLLHLVRNAIDHGIESAEDRIRTGKPSIGSVHLQAGHDSGNIIIRISDDGQGINTERVAQKAAELGLVKREPAGLARDTLSYIFEPGFSTLDTATTLSGRGVGMDVVKKTIESLRGRIDIETERGKGTTFRISIPLSLSLIDGFMVSLGDNLFILPMELVQETLELPDITAPGILANGCLQVREHPLPCLDLRKLLDIPGTSSTLQYVVVVHHEKNRVGLIVDQLLGELKTVVKPLGPFFHETTCVSGASILGDGAIALILEIEHLMAYYHT